MYNTIDWSFIDYKPKNDHDFVYNCLTSKLWRMNNLYYVKNKQGRIVLFRMNHAQRKVASCKHNRKIILKSRQQGISTYKLVDSFDDCMFNPNLTLGVMAQGKKEASDMLEKAKLMWARLNPEVKEFLGIKADVDNATDFGFSNNSKIMVRVSFRSGTLQGLHVSELGKIAAKDPKKAYELKTGTLQAIGDERKVTIESTAEGKSGYFYELWCNAERMTSQGSVFSNLDFYPVFLSWLEDNDCHLATPQSATEEDNEYFAALESQLGITITPEQRNFYIAKKRELGGHITQEYPSTAQEAFASAHDGSYYKHIIRSMYAEGRIAANIFDKNLPVFVAMDLGYTDSFVMVFWQRTDKGINKLFHCYSNERLPLKHYADYIKTLASKMGFEKQLAKVFMPHDAEQGKLDGKDGKSRAQLFRDYLSWSGCSVEVLKRKIVAEGIENVKAMLPYTYIDLSCSELIDALEAYSKEWDSTHGVWKKQPKHDNASHFADAVRYMAMSDCAGFYGVNKARAIGDKYYAENIANDNAVKYNNLGGNADFSFDV